MWMRDTKASSRSPGRFVVICFGRQYCRGGNEQHVIHGLAGRDIQCAMPFVFGCKKKDIIVRDGQEEMLTYEKNAVVVFKFTEEDRHQGVAVDIIDTSLLKKDICFV